MAKRKDGRAEIKRTVELPNGAKKEKSFYGTTKKAAVKSYDDYKIDLQNFAQKQTIHYFADVADKWLESRDGSVQQQTYKGYEYKVGMMKEYFKDKLISEIMDADVTIYLNKHSHQSINTVKKHKIYLNAIFDFAVRNDLLLKNQMTEVKMPKCKAAVTKRSYNKEQTKKICEQAKLQGLNGLAAYIPLQTGLRAGEVIALNVPRDIDFVNKTLTVNETVKVKSDKKTGEPKSVTSLRTIPVEDAFLNHIASLNFTGYIYDNGTGTGVPKNYNNWYHRNYERFMETLPDDIPRYFPHELRHTYGTLIYEDGTDLYTIMKVMGHANVAVTQIYVHHSTETMRDKLKKDF